MRKFLMEFTMNFFLLFFAHHSSLSLIQFVCDTICAAWNYTTNKTRRNEENMRQWIVVEFVINSIFCLFIHIYYLYMLAMEWTACPCMFVVAVEPHCFAYCFPSFCVSRVRNGVSAAGCTDYELYVLCVFIVHFIWNEILLNYLFRSSCPSYPHFHSVFAFASASLSLILNELTKVGRAEQLR